MHAPAESQKALAEEKAHSGDKEHDAIFQKGSEFYNKGIVLYDPGKHTEALQAFDEAIRLDPNNDAAFTNKGVELGWLGKFEESLEAYWE